MDIPVTEALRAVLYKEHFAYQEKENTFIYIAAYGGHKWKTVIRYETPDILTIYSVYPFAINNHFMQNPALSLQQYNREQRVGCFITDANSARVIFRYGIPLIDPFSAPETIKYALFAAAAVTNAYWDRIFALAQGCNRARKAD